MALYSLTNMLQPENVASGISDFILLAPVYDFEVDGIKCPEAPFAAPGDEVKITSPHVFTAGRGFAKFVCAPEKNQFNAKSIGDKGFNKLDFEYDFFIAGSSALLHEQIKNLINQPLIALCKDSNCDSEMWYQFGCDCIYAWLSVDFSTGTTKDGIKGYNGKLTYQNGYVLLYDVDGGPEMLGT